MSERDGYPPGVPCWVDTLQPDLDAALRFYGGLFGWAFGGPGPMPADAPDRMPGRYFVARVRGRDVAGIGSLPPEGAPLVPAWATHVSVESAGQAVESAKRAGGSVIVPAFDALPAGRMAVLQDPAGAVFCVWEAADRKGAQLVNEPRAWAMSTLWTADPRACARFYDAVFGWKTDTFGKGKAAVTLWRLPGYVGGEPRQPVPRDVVAVMAPGTRGVPSHWAVDFWIDDTDAAISRAVRLGGTVISPAHDTPIFRSAVLRDPQGAVFSISQLIMDGGNRGRRAGRT
jgi:predicted enzyme related to lactoylglutathione lyase